MPIASGAEGRVDVGIDTSVTWTPQGPKKRTKPTNKKCDSYLQRYQELKQQRSKSNSVQQSTQDNTDPIDRENDGPKEELPEKTGSSKDEISGKVPSEEPSKKSVLCLIL